MKANKKDIKGSQKTILAATMIIGAGTLLFQGLTQAVAAGELNKVSTIPTSYVSYKDNSSQKAENNLPEGYSKANYTVETIQLEAYLNRKPTINDITREDAAEIGAQALWGVYNVNLEDQVLEMGYNEPNDFMPRNTWFGTVIINDKQDYYFEIDSLTGELLVVGCTRTLDENVPLGFDLALEKNSQEYNEPIKAYAEKYNVVHGAVKSVEYGGQGYINNDPDINFVVTGENGECAQINVSRHDKALLSISYPADYKYVIEYNKKREKELEKEMKEMIEKDKNNELNWKQVYKDSDDENKAVFILEEE